MFFLWLSIQNSVPTCEVLGSRGFTLDTIYPICQKEAETLQHILRDCHYARNFWNKLGVPAECRSYFLEDMGEWLHLNCTSMSSQHDIPWKITFPMGVWHLWLHRNADIFRKGIVDDEFYMQCRQKVAEFFAIAVEGKVQAEKHLQAISWQKPPAGWVKLNSDGSARGSAEGWGGQRNTEE
ncbi:hypothetical protein ACB092_04G077300 [Castanea dentata]